MTKSPSTPSTKKTVSSVKLSDIAKMTGYSLATVSKTLNGRSDVSPTARKVIKDALQKSGYARRFPSQKPRQLVEVVFQDFDSIWALEVLRGILSEAKFHHASVITTESGDRQHPGSSWIDGVLYRKPTGVILIFSDLTDEERNALDSHNIPFVIFDPSGDPTINSMSVQADNWTGGLIATRHLLKLGHTRIGVIAGPNEMVCSRARLDGYIAALAEYGIPLDPSLITEGDFTTPGGYAQAMTLLEDPALRPTAIFAGSDLQAMGVYEAARQLRLRIPDDLSIVGFDDIQTSAFLGPGLTTVRQPLKDMARAATRMVLTNDGIKTEEQQHIIMPTSLVVRSSTRAIHTA